jgi:CheY-like chemotaxis protein
MTSYADMSRLAALVVDDNQHMRAILLTLLRALGIKNLAEASDGADALSLLQSRPFDFLLADINMQPIDGIEFTQMVRRSADSIAPMIPIIMVTGHTERSKVTAARDAGVTEFVAKPVTAQALYLRVQEVIERPRPFVRTASFFGPDRRRRVDPKFKGPHRRKADAEVNIQPDTTATFRAP